MVYSNTKNKETYKRDDSPSHQLGTLLIKFSLSLLKTDVKFIYLVEIESTRSERTPTHYNIPGSDPGAACSFWKSQGDDRTCHALKRPLVR